MKYYPTNLSEILQDKNTNIKKYLQISRGLCNTVEFLWKNRVLHRDLKPDNITLDTNYSPKIIDFGSSKPIGKINNDL